MSHDQKQKHLAFVTQLKPVDNFWLTAAHMKTQGLLVVGVNQPIIISAVHKHMAVTGCVLLSLDKKFAGLTSNEWVNDSKHLFPVQEAKTHSDSATATVLTVS